MIPENIVVSISLLWFLYYSLYTSVGALRTKVQTFAGIVPIPLPKNTKRLSPASQHVASALAARYVLSRSALASSGRCYKGFEASFCGNLREVFDVVWGTRDVAACGFVSAPSKK